MTEFTVSFKRSYKLIQIYRNLETIEEKEHHNLHVLKFREIRPQFFPQKTNYTGVDELIVNRDVNYEELKNKYSESFDLKKSSCARIGKPQNVINRIIKNG